MWGAIIRGFAWLLQFILPALGVVSAVASAAWKTFIAFLVGSKFWFTASTLLIVVGLFVLLDTAVSGAIRLVGAFVLATVPDIDSDIIDFISACVDFTPLWSYVSFVLTSALSLNVLRSSFWLFHRCTKLVGMITGAWKL